MDLFKGKLAMFLLMIYIFSAVQSIVFELNDYDLNRVVFNFERNITMTCNASEFVNPKIIITHEGIGVEHNKNNFYLEAKNNSLALTITAVNVTHAGTYECIVNDTGGMLTMSVISLTLNVTMGEHQCLQSGMSLTKTVGDHFTLYCYFSWFVNITMMNSPFSYTWNATIGNESSPLTDPSDIIPGSIKGVIITSIGPLTFTDNGTIYSCGLLFPINQEPCSIGPIIVEPTRIHPQTESTTTQQPTEQSEDLSVSRTIELIPPFSSGMPMTASNKQSTSMLDKTTARLNRPLSTQSTLSADTSFIIIISAGAAIVIVIFIVVLLCLVYCYTCRSRKETQEKTAKLDYELTDNPIYGPGDFEGDIPNTRPISTDPGGEPRGRQTTSFNSSPQKEASVYPTPAAHHFGRDSVHDGISYDKANDGKAETSGEVPKRGTKRGSHKYDDPPDRGDSTGRNHRYVNAFAKASPAKGSHKYDDPPGRGASTRKDNYGDVNYTGAEGVLVGRVDNRETGLDFSELYGVVKKEYKARYAERDDPVLY